MLTKVRLEGPMGKEFGREWNLAISSPAEALRLIDANKPGVFNWIRANLAKYSRYRVVCKYEDGRSEELDEGTYMMQGRLVSVSFIPLVEGSGNVGKIILGAILVVADIAFLHTGYLTQIGASLMIGGVIGLLTPQPKTQQQDEKHNKTSYFFDGPANTTMQGVPLQLIYGKEVLVGSHAISAKVSVDQLM